MPTVPTYQRQVRSSGISTPEARLRVPDLSGAVNQVFDKAQRAVSAADDYYTREKQKADDYYTKEKQKADRMVVLGAQEELDDFRSKYFNGDGDKNLGALNRKGEDAFGMPEDFEGQYKAKREEIAKRLSGDQSTLFNEYANKVKGDSDNTIRKHVSNETFNFNNAKLKSRITGLQDRASLSAYNPDEIRENIKQQNIAIYQFADANGLPREQADDMITEANSRTHRSILNTYMNKGEDIVAQTYFDKIKGTMTSDDRATVERSLEVTSTLGKSQRMADGILEKKLSLEESLAEAKNIDDPKLRDMVKARVKIEIVENQQAVRLNQEETYTDLFFQMAEGGVSFDKLDKEKLTSLTPERYTALANAGTKGVRKVSDPVKYQDFLTKAYDPNFKDDFLKTDAHTFSKSLSLADTKKMIDLQVKVRNRQVDEFEASGILNNQQIVKEAVRGLGISGDQGKKVSSELMQYADTQKREWEKENGKKMPQDQFKKLINDSLVKGQIDGSSWFSDTRKMLFQATPDELLNFKPDEESDEASVESFKIARANAIKERLAKIKLAQDIRARNPNYSEEELAQAVESIYKKRK